MSARNAAAGGGDRTTGEQTGDVLVEENQSHSVSLPSLMTPTSAAGMTSGMELPRKRKGSMDMEIKSASNLVADMKDEEDRSEGEDSQAKIKCFREPHSQIEKRRRDKMNNLIDELSAMIPTCNPMSRKLDKLTVLRMAVQHLKSLKGSTCSFAEANYKPSFLPDDELKHLILKAADGFLFVVGCDRGKIVFVSESINKTLNYSQTSMTNLIVMWRRAVNEVRKRYDPQLHYLICQMYPASSTLWGSSCTIDLSERKKTELIGQSLFDYIHPKDMEKVKEQLSASELYPRERLIDAKRSEAAASEGKLSGVEINFAHTMEHTALSGLQVQADLPVGAARLCPGARRSFFCRMKYHKISVKQEDKEFQSSTSKKKESEKYCTVHCTGYIRSWPTSQLGEEGGEGETDKDSSHFSCLVAVGRVHLHAASLVNGANEVLVKATEFVTRYAMDGKFTFVDQRATTVLGYLPQELLGTSCYEYFHQDDLPHLAERHRKVLRSKEKIETHCYKFKTKHGSFVTLQSRMFSFINPWTKEVEYIVSTNTVMSSDHSPTDRSGDKAEPSSNSKASEDDGNKSLPIIPGISSASSTMIYAGSIGTQIANELLDYNRMNSSPSSGNVSPFTVLKDKSPRQLTLSSSSVPNGEVADLEMPGKSSSEEGEQQELKRPQFPAGESLMVETSQLDMENMMDPGLGGLSNDEAAMAVIMSLLETDADLGEAVVMDEINWSL